MIWTMISEDWHSSGLGEVCQEEDGDWYFYPKHGDWVLIPYGPAFEGSTKAKIYAENRKDWL